MLTSIIRGTYNASYRTSSRDHKMETSWEVDEVQDTVAIHSEVVVEDL